MFCINRNLAQLRISLLPVGRALISYNCAMKSSRGVALLDKHSQNHKDSVSCHASQAKRTHYNKDRCHADVLSNGRLKQCRKPATFFHALHPTHGTQQTVIVRGDQFPFCLEWRHEASRYQVPGPGVYLITNICMVSLQHTYSTRIGA